MGKAMFIIGCVAGWSLIAILFITKGICIDSIICSVLITLGTFRGVSILYKPFQSNKQK